MAMLDPLRYSIAWIAPLHIEARAAICLLDRKHTGRFPLQRGDDYVFQAGEICGHNVVIATLPAGEPYGTGSAAALASQVKKYFPNLWFGLLVGVAAGLPRLTGPSPRDIRLGDILVALPEGESPALVAYELGKETKDGFKLLKDGHVMAVTEAVVRAAIGNIRLQAPSDMDVVLPSYNEIKDQGHSDGTFVDPGQDADTLYTIDHVGTAKVQPRVRRPDDRRTRIWYGSIGSGDKLLKHAAKRDALRDQHNLIGLEMEAAGTMNRIPVGVIRGVCDYGDEHKNKEWQPYAAAMAGAYAKAVLAQIGRRNLTNVYHIPFRRNRDFSGREPQLEQLGRMLFTEGRERVAVAGFGGMGKTQIALELAYRVQDTDLDNAEARWSVLWMPGQSVAAFQQAAMRIAQQLNLTVNKDDDVTKVLRAYLASESAGQWLVILDNVDDSAVLRGLSGRSRGLGDFPPQSRRGRTLVTTRSSQIAVDIAGSSVVELDAMTPDEAQKFLVTALVTKPGLEHTKNATELVRRLACLPLTIGQAVAYMNQNRLPIPAYLRLWMSTDQSMITLLSRQLRDETHHSEEQGAVATTWIISFEAISKEDPAAAYLLSFIQWIDCKAIPKTMLPVSGSEMDLVDSIGIICGYGFMSWREDGEMLDMHPLVHLALQLWTKQGQEGLMAKEDASQHLAEVFPSDDWNDRLIWRQYLPHVLPLVKEARSASHKAILRLGDKAGRCLTQDGRTRETVEIFTLTAAIRQETLPQTHPDRLASQNVLAAAYIINGQVEESIKLLEYEIQEKTLVETHPDRLDSQHILANAYQNNGQVKEAVELLKYVVAVREKTLRETHPHRLASESDLARAYQANGQVKESIKLLEYVVAVQEKTLVETHPDRLVSQNELAVIYRSNGQVKESIKLLEYIVAIQEKTLAETHPNRLGSQHELAITYRRNGQVKEAVELMKHVVAVQEKTLGETHPQRLASEGDLALAYQANGQFKEAIEVLEHLVAAGKTLAETDPPRLDWSVQWQRQGSRV